MTKIKLYIDEDSMDEDFVQALRSRNQVSIMSDRFIQIT